MSFLQDMSFCYRVINFTATVMGSTPHRQVQCPLLIQQFRADSCRSLRDVLPEAQGQKKTNGWQLFLRSLVRATANRNGGRCALSICSLLQILISGCSPNQWFFQQEANSGYVQSLRGSELKNTSHRRPGSSVKQNQVNLPQHTHWLAKNFSVHGSLRWPYLQNFYSTSPAYVCISKG